MSIVAERVDGRELRRYAKLRVGGEIDEHVVGGRQPHRRPTARTSVAVHWSNVVGPQIHRCRRSVRTRAAHVRLQRRAGREPRGGEPLIGIEAEEGIAPTADRLAGREAHVGVHRLEVRARQKSQVVALIARGDTLYAADARINPDTFSAERPSAVPVSLARLESTCIASSGRWYSCTPFCSVLVMALGVPRTSLAENDARQRVSSPGKAMTAVRPHDVGALSEILRARGVQ